MQFGDRKHLVNVGLQVEQREPSTGGADPFVQLDEGTQFLTAHRLDMSKVEEQVAAA
jgi:hypothetical protein